MPSNYLQTIYIQEFSSQSTLLLWNLGLFTKESFSSLEFTFKRNRYGTYVKIFFLFGIPAGEAADFVYSVNRYLIANWNNYVTPYNVYTGIMQID